MIEIKNLNKTYDNKNKALKNINIHIEQGEFVFIMGRSGSGKSTLMKILLKEVEPTSGQVIVNDMELGKMPRRYVPKYRKMLGVVFQDFRLLKHMTVYENVAFAQRVLGLPVRRSRRTSPPCCGRWDCPPSINPIRISCLEESSREWPLPGL